jgi:hypothetical protein
LHGVEEGRGEDRRREEGRGGERSGQEKRRGEMRTNFENPKSRDDIQDLETDDRIILNSTLERHCEKELTAFKWLSLMGFYEHRNALSRAVIAQSV